MQRLIDQSRSAVSRGTLSDLYSKRIEKCQQQTRSRATWSFIFAILAMSAGLGFVIWGGRTMVNANGSDHLIAGGALSAIGGAMSAYITTTFLKVHKLSLSQLNHYFQQPVINDHVLMAQRLADDLDDLEFRKKSYWAVIDSLSSLIRHETPPAGTAESE